MDILLSIPRPPNPSHDTFTNLQSQGYFNIRLAPTEEEVFWEGADEVVGWCPYCGGVDREHEDDVLEEEEEWERGRELRGRELRGRERRLWRRPEWIWEFVYGG